MNHPRYVTVRCGCCKKTHKVKNKGWIICPVSNWYILVYEDGTQTQTSHFANIKITLDIWREKLEKAIEEK